VYCIETNNINPLPPSDAVRQQKIYFTGLFQFSIVTIKKIWAAFDSAKNHKRQRRKRQSVTAKREKSQTPKFV